MRKNRIFLVVGIVFLSGCSGLIGSDEGTATQTETITHTPAETETNTPTEPQNLSEQEEAYKESGERFGMAIDGNIHRHEHTSLKYYEGHPNNTVELAIRTDGEVPLERSVMDGAQISAAMAHYATTDNETLAARNISEPPYHQPGRIAISIYDPGGEILGVYEVDSTMARDYRQATISPREFADGVMDTYESRRSYDRGEMRASNYLNRSELTIWIKDYREEVQNWSENGSIEQPFPVDNIRFNESSGETLHEFQWGLNEYGQSLGSATGTAFTGYWRTTDDSFAMAPTRLKLYIHVTDGDEDYAGYMDRDVVWWLLQTDRDTPARVEYLDQEEWRWVEKDADPFEDDF